MKRALRIEDVAELLRACNAPESARLIQTIGACVKNVADFRMALQILQELRKPAKPSYGDTLYWPQLRDHLGQVQQLPPQIARGYQEGPGNFGTCAGHEARRGHARGGARRDRAQGEAHQHVAARFHLFLKATPRLPSFFLRNLIQCETMKEIPSQYIAKEHEDRIYRMWEESGAFRPEVSRYEGKQVRRRSTRVPNHPRTHVPQCFSIIMPPPNVTGTLHIGHAVMLALEDIMVRYHRMKGEPTLWIPGTDHAAIATQTVVEKKLKKEQNETRHRLGREKFLEEVQKFVDTSKDRIHLQIRKMGASCDWSREAYTLDEPRTHAVRTAFKMLYDKGLIYRGDRIVNWCPRCKSTLADDEVEYKEEKTKFYYFKYGPVVIGTARPETKFLDKTIVVHPDDARYKKLHGKEMEVEWIDGTVHANVIADPVVDPEFGTGAMTITPAHSFEDFDLAQRHKLPIVKIIDEDGNFTQAAGAFSGKNARKNRDEIVEILEKKGLVDHIDENYKHNLSVCYRCETPIEPLPKLQWFIGVNTPFKFIASEHTPIKGIKNGQEVTLKQLMRHVVESEQIQIIPEHSSKNYFHWIDNLRDWCISRQIWFGHRIPVWYRSTSSVIPSEVEESHAAKNGKRVAGQGVRSLADARYDNAEVYVGTEPPQSEGWAQDPDTLDTWFSSGLWTFSTLGWPEKTKDFEMFHPTAVLETGYDILFFWIARMILMSTALIGEIPFRTVYLHGLVRDMQGRKMSKSIGNVIDPLDMTEKYGADAVRISLFMGTSAGTDVKLNEQKIAGYRNFANKIWNASRFVLMNLDPSFVIPSGATRGSEVEESHTNTHGKRVAGQGVRSLAAARDDIVLSADDKKILTELNVVVTQVTEYLDKLDFNHAGDAVYHYFWHTFCDKIIEAMKPRLGKENVAQTFRSDVRSKDLSYDDQDRRAAQYILLTCLTTSLKLLHPFMPFVTEAVWQQIPRENKSMLITEQWPP